MTIVFSGFPHSQLRAYWEGTGNDKKGNEKFFNGFPRSRE